LTGITRRQVEILRIVFAAKRPNVRAIADKLGSPNRLSGDLVELIQKRYLHIEREGKEHFYTIMKPGRTCLGKYEGEAAESSIATIASLGEIQMLRGILEHATLTRFRCKKCGATNWDEGDKRVKVRYEEYGEGDEWVLPILKCGCGNESGEVCDYDGAFESFDYSQFDKETVSVETALEEARSPPKR
jgi:hypothetical protein